MISISRCRFFSSFSDLPTLGMNFKATTFQSRQSWDQTRLPPALAEAVFNPIRTQHFPAEHTERDICSLDPLKLGLPQALGTLTLVLTVLCTLAYKANNCNQ